MGADPVVGDAAGLEPGHEGRAGHVEQRKVWPVVSASSPSAATAEGSGTMSASVASIDAAAAADDARTWSGVGRADGGAVGGCGGTAGCSGPACTEHPELAAARSNGSASAASSRVG